MSFKTYWFFIALMLLALPIKAQTTFKGVVKDASSHAPVPFVSIKTNNGMLYFTDAKGKFLLTILDTVTTIQISRVGFESQKLEVKAHQYYKNIYLKPFDTNKEALSKKNTAQKIIKNVIFYKKHNDPLLRFKTFDFKTYNKTLVTATPDSLKGNIDSVFITRNGFKILTKVDSSDYKLKQIITKNHLFLLEKLSLFQYVKNNLKETILDAKMAGFKKPLYEILGFNLQSFSVYNNHYELAETKYISPLSDHLYNEYDFTLLDEAWVEGRKTAVIYFKNKKKSKSKGLEGVLYIDKSNFGVAKAVLGVGGILNISGVHDFEYSVEKDIWFPKHKKFIITKGKNNEDIQILGLKIHFDNNDILEMPSHDKKLSDYLYLISESKNFDIQIDQPVNIKRPSIAIQAKEEPTKVHRQLMDSLCIQHLDDRTPNTYRVLDSLSVKNKLESRIAIARKFRFGYLPIGKIDVDLKKIFTFNNHEGLRFGIGGMSNEKLSSLYKLEGYTAYGTKDGVFKYHLGSSVRVGNFSNSWIGMSYTDDVRELGSTKFLVEKTPFKIYDGRPFNITNFYNIVSLRAYIETRIIPKTESVWEISHNIIEPKFNYMFANMGREYRIFNLTTAQVSIQWNPFSDYMQTPIGRFEIEKRFPKFTFQLTKTLPKIIENDFDFFKIDFKFDYEKEYLNKQKTGLILNAGLTVGDVPITHLFNMLPNNPTKDNLWERLTTAGKNSFETMFYNEFFSSNYVFLQAKHAFVDVPLFQKKKPTIVLVSRFAYGNMNRMSQHIGLPFKTLEKGYYESGIEINQLYKGFGLSGFYRYGPYQFENIKDNLALRLTFAIQL